MEKGGFVGDDSASSASYDNSGSSSSASNRDAYLRHVSKNSHKIAKPIWKPLPPSPVAKLPPPSAVGAEDVVGGGEVAGGEGGVVLASSAII